MTWGSSIRRKVHGSRLVVCGHIGHVELPADVGLDGEDDAELLSDLGIHAVAIRISPSTISTDATSRSLP